MKGSKYGCTVWRLLNVLLKLFKPSKEFLKIFYVVTPRLLGLNLVDKKRKVIAIFLAAEDAFKRQARNCKLLTNTSLRVCTSQQQLANFMLIKRKVVNVELGYCAVGRFSD